MHAIIRQGNGQYYVSAVFGYYQDIIAAGDHKRYPDEVYKPPYWIVLDPEKKRLIRWPTVAPDQIYYIPQILIVDSDQSNWVMDDQGIGCVDFLSRELLDSFLDMDNQPEDVLKKCRSIDADYVYDETPEIRTQKDIDDLMWACGGFQVVWIEKEELQEDGTLYLRFDGTWGCKIEVWFWGDLEYDTSSRNQEESDPFWSGSTVLLQDGFVFFIDDDDMTVDDIGSGCCYFKARHMKYHVIPE